MYLKKLFQVMAYIDTCGDIIKKSTFQLEAYYERKAWPKGSKLGIVNS